MRSALIFLLTQRHTTTIGPDGDLLAQEVQHILFRHTEEDAVCAAFGFHHQSGSCFGHGAVPDLAHLIDIFAVGFRAKSVGGDHINGFTVLLFRKAMVQLCQNLTSLVRSKPSCRSRYSALQRPFRQDIGNAGCRRCVRVHISRYSNAVFLCLLDVFPNFRCPTPLLLAAGFQVGYVDFCTCLSVDFIHFFQGSDNLRSLIAHMGSDDTVVFGYHLTHCVQFLLVGKHTGRIAKTQCHSPGSVCHLFVQQGSHVRQLLCGGFSSFKAHDAGAQSSMSDHRKLVGRHWTISTLGFFNKLRHRGRNIGIPLAANRGKLLHQFQIFRLTRINGVAALTGHLGGDALKQLGLTAAVGQKGRITVRVKINKAGNCRQPAKVYDFLRFLCYRLLGKYCNFPLCNPDIPMKGRCTCTVIDNGIF